MQNLLGRDVFALPWGQLALERPVLRSAHSHAVQFLQAGASWFHCLPFMSELSGLSSEWRRLQRKTNWEARAMSEPGVGDRTGTLAPMQFPARPTGGAGRDPCGCWLPVGWASLAYRHSSGGQWVLPVGLLSSLSSMLPDQVHAGKWQVRGGRWTSSQGAPARQVLLGTLGLSESWTSALS